MEQILKTPVIKTLNLLTLCSLRLSGKNNHMSQYTLTIIITNAGNKEISHQIQLTETYETYPEDYFIIPNNQTQLQNIIETKTARKVDKIKLQQIINTWLQDIREGLHRTTIRTELPLDILPNQPIQNITETMAPAKLLQPQPKLPNKKLNKTEEETIITEVRSTTNQYDF